MKYTTIFFDLDDTLWDTVNNNTESLEDIYNDYKINKYYPTFSDFYNVYSPNTNKLWAMYSKGEIDKPTLLRERFLYPFRSFSDVTEEMSSEMNADFLNRVQFKKGTVAGAIELLDYLKSKYRLHIISNGFTEIQYTKMKSAGLNPYFDKVILSDGVGVNKPHPDIFNFALKEAGVNPQDVIMIGDNLQTDIIGAMNSKIDQVWFNPNDEISGSVEPTYVVKNLLEIKSIL
ncbi:YjjG family noncanonical pyrimidine nucleotidase [Dysgonomonas sp. ZJ279]|uniref:YjjG family noncanonical pyrimidine nucleotidase n=1 Tax=Dysgonomonas sp. ZJ279 TaxID=2709796 RepID=UPI0013EACF9F|nr:YjjG family noncanonical pyrimidine nucleotidase [Dysgonomonas sp. ZJ279]